MPVEQSAFLGDQTLFWSVVWLTVLIVGSNYTVFRLLSKQIEGLQREVKELSEMIADLWERTADLEAKTTIIGQRVMRPEERSS